MTVFKTFWNIVKAYKGTIILYIGLLIVFGGLNQKANANDTTFVNVKPDVLIVNNDEEIGLTKNFIEYIENNTNIKDVKNDEEAIDDALFYRDVNYVIYIPKNYRKDTLSGLSPTIEIKSSKDYKASFTEIMINRYLKLQSVYLVDHNEEETIKLINTNLARSTNIEIASKLDTTELAKNTNYFNFAAYSIMASVIYIICLVLSSFHTLNIKKRTIISSMSYRKHNRLVLLSSTIFAFIIWALIILLDVILIGSSIFSFRGLIYIINTLLFTFVALTLAILISTLVNNKDAISGIVNVVALSQAFLCGSFVPAEWLPSIVLKIAHVLPAYWFINSNNLLLEIEKINIESLMPIIFNLLMLIVFMIIFIVINNIVSKHKQKIG